MADVVDVLLAKIVLDGTCVSTIIDELVSGRVPGHVRMDRKRKSRGPTCCGDFSKG
jgi:hypothetical protein